MKHLSISVREGRFLLQASVLVIGPDLMVSIWGGTHPHIGAVALALPRPSLKDKKKTSATSSVLTVLGHKEDQTVKVVSETLSSVFKKNVVVTAGIHWDNLRSEEITSIVKLTEKLILGIINKLAKGERPDHV
jgi:gallate decarboxylase subunit D